VRWLWLQLCTAHSSGSRLSQPTIVLVIAGDGGDDELRRGGGRKQLAQSSTGGEETGTRAARWHRTMRIPSSHSSLPFARSLVLCAGYPYMSVVSIGETRRDATEATERRKEGRKEERKKERR